MRRTLTTLALLLVLGSCRSTLAPEPPKTIVDPGAMVEAAMRLPLLEDPIYEEWEIPPIADGGGPRLTRIIDQLDLGAGVVRWTISLSPYRKFGAGNGYLQPHGWAFQIGIDNDFDTYTGTLAWGFEFVTDVATRELVEGRSAFGPFIPTGYHVTMVENGRIVLEIPIAALDDGECAWVLYLYRLTEIREDGRWGENGFTMYRGEVREPVAVR